MQRVSLVLPCPTCPTVRPGHPGLHITQLYLLWMSYLKDDTALLAKAVIIHVLIVTKVRSHDPKMDRLSSTGCGHGRKGNGGALIRISTITTKLNASLLLSSKSLNPIRYKGTSQTISVL